MLNFDPSNLRILRPEAAVEAMLAACRHQLSSPIGRQRSPELADMLGQTGKEGFAKRFRAMSPLRALTELVHATANEGLDCEHQGVRPSDVELISTARGEALMSLANEGQYSCIDQEDAKLLSCELEFALGDAQTFGCERDACIYQALLDVLDDPKQSNDVYGRRHGGAVFSRHFEPEREQLRGFNQELAEEWAMVAASSDGVDSLYVRRDDLDAGREAGAVRLVSAPGAALLGMPLLSSYGQSTRVNVDDLADYGICPSVQDIIAPLPGHADNLAATVASLTQDMNLEPTPDAGDVQPARLRDVIKPGTAATPQAPVAGNNRAPSLGL